MEAKRYLAETLNGLSVAGKTQILEQMESVTDAQADLTNFASTQDERLEQSVQMLLRGFNSSPKNFSNIFISFHICAD